MKSRFIKPTDIIQPLPENNPFNNCTLESSIFHADDNCTLVKKPKNGRHTFTDAYLINNSKTLIGFIIPKEATSDIPNNFLNYYKFFYKDLLKKDDEPLITIHSSNFFIGEKIENNSASGRFSSPIEIENLEIFYDSEEKNYIINILIDNSLIHFKENLTFSL